MRSKTIKRGTFALKKGARLASFSISFQFSSHFVFELLHFSSYSNAYLAELQLNFPIIFCLLLDLI